MDWTKILYICLSAVMGVLIVLEARLLKKSKKLNDEIEEFLDDILKNAEDIPKLVPCYECCHYKEGEPFCPKSNMKMKDGLIFCCYGEREQGRDLTSEQK